MNTNESDLNGLTFKLNSDEALRSRLSIQWWRKQDKSPEEKRAIMERYLDNPDMGYSLYIYLLKELDLSDYQPTRYHNEQKDQIIAQLLARNKSPLAEFVDLLMYADEAPNEVRGPDEPNLYLIRSYTPRSNHQEGSFEYMIATEFIAEFYKQSHVRMSVDKMKGEMTNLGWNMPQGGTKKIYGKSVRCFVREPQEREAEDIDCI
jgi:hypothetical protein